LNNGALRELPRKLLNPVTFFTGRTSKLLEKNIKETPFFAPSVFMIFQRELFAPMKTLLENIRRTDWSFFERPGTT
jgi:hypothetical protein